MALATLRGEAFSFPLAEPCPSGWQTITGNSTNGPLVAGAPQRGLGRFVFGGGGRGPALFSQARAGDEAVGPTSTVAPPLPSSTSFLPPTPALQFSRDSAAGEGSVHPPEPGGLSSTLILVILRPACVPHVVSLHTRLDFN